MKNASSPFEFNSDAAAQGPLNPGRYNAMSSAGRSVRRGFSGKRTAVAGMTAVSLALGGLTVPSVVGGGGSGFAEAQTADQCAQKPLRLSLTKGTYINPDNSKDRTADSWQAVINPPNNDRCKHPLSRVVLYIGESQSNQGSIPATDEYIVHATPGTGANPKDYYVGTATGNAGTAEYNGKTYRTITLDLPERMVLLGDQAQKQESDVRRISIWKRGAADSMPYSGAQVGRDDFVLQQSSTASVSGKIEGLPKDKSVTVTIGDKSTTVDANGEYTIEGVPAGEQQVVVSDLPGYSIEYPGTVTVSPEGTPSVDVTVSPNPSSVSGKIEGLPKDKSVTVTIGDKSTTVDANGEYTIEGVPAG
ncbi:carboxypeptidase-like regulatory domain-containing protein, partial [Corynebacterium faecium]|uniref:carboxypeptidase-like regulatory domain-containing protein n=1 Tax=Corynebacterium faecium TaxID=3016001 RepID=UPI0022B400DD